MTLKECRISKKLTQAEAAELCSVSLRSYSTLENDKAKTDTLKYKYAMGVLSGYCPLDETHGLLTTEEIKEKSAPVFSEYGAEYCYLFGSYAKGRANEQSDVDLLVKSDVKGLRFFGMAEGLREALCKKVDVLDFGQLTNNPELLNEILKDGIKIYG